MMKFKLGALVALSLVAASAAQAQQPNLNLIVGFAPGGSDIVARSPADVHTLLVVFPSFVINPSLIKNLPYDTVKDFTALGYVVSTPLAVVVQRLHEVARHVDVQAVLLHVVVTDADAGPHVDRVPGLGDRLEHVVRVRAQLPVPHHQRMVDVEEDVQLPHVSVPRVVPVRASRRASTPLRRCCAARSTTP